MMYAFHTTLMCLWEQILFRELGGVARDFGHFSSLLPQL